MPGRRRLVAGCMSGTSLDGIDAALVEVHGEGMAMGVRLEATATRGLGTLGRALRRLAEQQPTTAAEVARCARELGLAHLELLEQLLAGRRPDLVAVHGQTLYHGGALSLQLIDPHPIAHGLGAPVVFDLRGGDRAAGGRGAPITPLADLILFRDATRARTVINLGGFVNLTRLPAGAADPDQVAAADLCACNQLLDEIARSCLDLPYDPEGEHAAAGSVLPEPLQALLARLAEQAEAGRALGTGDELRDWVAAHAPRHPGGHLARTACAAIARTIASAVRGADEVVLAGGGTRHRTLLAELEAQTPARLLLSDDLGIPAAYREAAAMALLGALAADGTPITLPQVTGRAARGRPTGCWVRP